MPSYEIRLTVTDSRGLTDTDTVFVEIVTPIAPPPPHWSTRYKRILGR